MLIRLRSLAFFLGYVSFTVVWGSLSLLVAWALPFKQRFNFIIGTWTAVMLRWLKITCGIDYAVEGREHIPSEPCVIICKHESTWESLALQQLFSPQATLVKRELLRIPFFGWAFALLKPIAIDRGDRRKALRALIEKGGRRLEDGIWVLLFPEGTRTEPGELKPLQGGVGLLAKTTGAPVLVVGHDAGRHWPARQFLKIPGTIRVKIAPPIPTTGKSTKEIIQQAEAELTRLTIDLYGPCARIRTAEPDAAANPEPLPGSS